MKVEFFPDTKTLYIELALGAAHATADFHGLIVDFDSKGKVMGVTIEDTNLIEGFDLSIHNARWTSETSLNDLAKAPN